LSKLLFFFQLIYPTYNTLPSIFAGESYSNPRAIEQEEEQKEDGDEFDDFFLQLNFF